MNGERVVEVLGEWGQAAQAGADPELEAIRLAILVEDAFDVVLADEEINLGTLTDAEAVLRIVTERGGR